MTCQIKCLYVDSKEVIIMNLEQLTTINVDTTTITEISQLCNKLISQRKAVELAEIALKNAEAAERHLSEEVIPTKMQEAGISSLTLTDGSSVEVSPYYYAKISEDKKADAFDWLRKNNFADLIKNNLTVTFSKGEDSSAVQLKAELEKKGLVVDQKEDIHWQTLRGFVKEQVEKGNAIPSDLFGLYVANRTKIKTNN